MGRVFSSARNTGEEFADPDVVRCYACRPAYPTALHERLVRLAPGLGAALDIGCGPGKLALPLASRFREVTAVDPSQQMLNFGRSLQPLRGNVQWIRSRAEDISLTGGFDLVTIGAAIHWLQLDQVMPKLRQALVPGGVLALVDGDAPSDAPWIDDYRAHVRHWVERGGAQWREAGDTAPPYLEWLSVGGRETFETTVSQRVDDLIEAEHSRATWARTKMGPVAAAEFDSDLRTLLEPHATAGRIAYTMRTSLVWGSLL